MSAKCNKVKHSKTEYVYCMQCVITIHWDAIFGVGNIERCWVAVSLGLTSDNPLYIYISQQGDTWQFKLCLSMGIQLFTNVLKLKGIQNDYWPLGSVMLAKNDPKPNSSLFYWIHLICFSSLWPSSLECSIWFLTGGS